MIRKEINETKCYSFKNFNKINKTLGTMIKKKNEKQKLPIETKKITTDSMIKQN